MSNNILKAGDFLLTHAGEEHQATALENTVILVINEKKHNKYEERNNLP
jgi:quercetin dioxygenase-like cupin family protein